MAILHVSEAEAALTFHALLSQVSLGTEIRIDRGDQTIAVLQPPSAIPIRKTLSEAIRHAEERNSSVTLDDRWGADLEAVIKQHEKDVLFHPWE